MFRAVAILFMIQFLIDQTTQQQRQNVSQDEIDDPSEEARLIRFLLRRYASHGKAARPLMRTGPGSGQDGVTDRPVEVKYGLRLIYLDLDEKEQVMRVSSWIRMNWYDDYLKWNRSDFGGIYKITLPYDGVWNPDIMLANTPESSLSTRLPSLQVRDTGSVFWTPHAHFTSACLIDITSYPFDEHTCDMWFQSMAHYSSTLNLIPYTSEKHNTSLDLSTYLDNYKASQEWTVIDNKTDLFARSHEAGMRLVYSNRPALRFRLVLKRKAGFQAYMLTIPAVLLSLLTWLTFCLPPERPDRHAIAMSLFASSLILLLLLSSEAPPSGGFTPILCMYYGYNMMALMASIFCSVLVINVSTRASLGSPVPTWMRRLFLRALPSFRCIRAGNAVINAHLVVRPNSSPDMLPATDQWHGIAAVLDRIFLGTFLIMGILAFLFLSPML